MSHPKQITHDVLRWTEFGEHRAYILMAIARRKFNEEITNNTEVIHRRVLTEEDYVEQQVRELLGMMEAHDLNFRLYLTVNAHDTMSAYHTFVRKVTEWAQEIINGHEGTEKKIGRVGSEWKSVLHKPEHRTDSYFLFDLDDVTEEEVWKFERTLDEETEIVGWAKTPNGYHFVTEPFNHPQWQSPVEYDDLKTDGMVHIAEVEP